MDPVANTTWRARAQRDEENDMLPSLPSRATTRAPHDVLSVRARIDDRVAVVELDGPVCAYTAGHLDAELAKLAESGQHRLVIDARNVRPLCLDGVDVLVSHKQRCVAAGGDLVLRHLRPGARRVLDILSLEHLTGPVAVGSL